MVHLEINNQTTNNLEINNQAAYRHRLLKCILMEQQYWSIIQHSPVFKIEVFITI
jgi:hypothetical protein